MELEDQVLNVEQIKELQELGFDVKKYSSFQSNGKEIIIKNDFYIGAAPLFETMSIGDIIDVLPNRIYTDNFYYLTISDGVVKYHSEVFSDKGMFRGFGLTIKDGLFEALKWCIQEKHIEL